MLIMMYDAVTRFLDSERTTASFDAIFTGVQLFNPSPALDQVLAATLDHLDYQIL